MAASQRNAEEPRPRKRRRREKDEEIKGGDPDLGTPLQRPEGLRRTSQLLSLHRARFVDWEPTAVTALAASSDGTVLAVARDSGVLELWETEHWTCLTVNLAACGTPHCGAFECDQLRKAKTEIRRPSWAAGIWQSPALRGFKEMQRPPGAYTLEGLTGLLLSGTFLRGSPSTGQTHLVVQCGRWLLSQSLLKVGLLEAFGDSCAALHRKVSRFLWLPRGQLPLAHMTAPPE